MRNTSKRFCLRMFLLTLIVFCAVSSQLFAQEPSPVAQEPSSVASESFESKQNQTALTDSGLTIDEYQQLEAVQIYTQDELIELINKNEHLFRVKQIDRCQLVQDIEARADVLQQPAYQFLWGDMLAWGVCVEKDAVSGVDFMQKAARQGLPAALEQLGRYYRTGTLVQPSIERSIMMLREAAALGNINAQLQLAQLFVDGYGTPLDYEDLYHWLFNNVTDNDEIHEQVSAMLAELELLMSPRAVREAKKPRTE